MKKTIRPVLREPPDIIQDFYDNRSVIIISKSDMEEARIIRRRIAESLKEKGSSIFKGVEGFKFYSVTYPEEILTEGHLINRLDAIAKHSTN